jgi:hypothetical protein
VRPKRFLSLWYVQHKPCTYIALTLTLSPKRTETRFHMTHSSRTSIGCIQDDFRAYGTFGKNHAPILRQDYHYLQTDSNKLQLEPRHLGISPDASKMISEPMVHSAQTVHLYWTDSNTISKRIETRFRMTQSPMSSIGCVQDDFRADGTFDTNHRPILRQV